MQNKSENRYFINSLARGLGVLEALAESPEPMTLSQLSEHMGFSLPTTYRFLHTLETLEFVERTPDTKAYRIAPRVLVLGYGLFRSSDLWQKAHPYLVRASKEYGETFNLSIPDGISILYIDRVKTRRILTIDLEIGSKLPAYCTSMGRVLLAFMPRNKALDILHRSKLEELTPKTVTSVSRIEAILDRIKEKGYAVNDGEMALELRSVAAPVRDMTGEVIAALNMAVHASQYEKDRLENELSQVVKTIAGQISKAMGFYKEKAHGQ